MNPGPSVATIEQMRQGPFVPGRNADPDVVALKYSHIRDPHVAPINALADRVADAEGIARGLVPYVDPQMGGIEATVLALLDNPSTKAEAGTGSGLLSLENNDGTARFCAEKYNAFGLTPGEVVHWNVAPAPIAGPKNTSSMPAERVRGARWLHELLELLPNLRVILLMGDNARDGWKRSGLTPDGVVIPPAVPHPSWKGMRNTDADLRLHRGMIATMTAPHGPGLTFPPEPAPSGERADRQTDRRQRKVAKTTASTPPPAAISTDPDLSDGQLWGWWPTREHYSAPGSLPWGTSRSLARIEAAIDDELEYADKMHPIARYVSGDWVLERKRTKGQTVELKKKQAGLYIRARDGGSRGSLDPVPPVAELTRATVDLDQ